MDEQEIKQLLSWRVKRGYKALNLREGNKAWTVGYGPKNKRTSKNFTFDPKYDLQVLWQLEEACSFLENNCRKIEPQYQHLGPTRVCRLRHEMTDGNDMEGVFLERHANGVIRLQFQLHMPTERYKFAIPKKLHNDEMALSWCLAFGRQVRGLSFFKETDYLEHEAIKTAWKNFTKLLLTQHFERQA